MSNLRDRIAAFENKPIVTGLPPPSSTKGTPTASQRVGTTSTAVTSGSTNHTESSSSSTATTTNGSTVKKPVGTFKRETAKQLPPTPTDRSSLNIGLTNTTPTHNSNNNGTLHKMPPPQPSPRLSSLEHQDSTLSNISTTISHGNGASSATTPYSPNDASSVEQDEDDDVEVDQQGTEGSQVRKTTSDLTSLPKNKPAVPPRFRNAQGNTGVIQGGSVGLKKTTHKNPPSLPNARRANPSISGDIHNLGSSEEKTLTTSLDPSTQIVYSDASSAARISVRASMVPTGPRESEKTAQGKFIPYIPPEVEDTVVTVTNTGAVISTVDSASDTEEFSKIYARPSKKQVDSAIVLQKYIRRWSSRKSAKKIQKARLNRENCTKEILSTEKYYVESLNILQEVYLKPLKAMAAKDKPIITLQEVQAIFSDMDVIMNVNSTFYKDLEERLQHYEHEIGISDIFLTMAPFFKTYSRYCNNFDKANEVLRECKKREDFKEVVVKMDKDSRTSKLGLQSYLILPIQRIPRYRLLLQDLIKHSGPEHPDYKGLKLALEKICEVADHLNNTMKIIEATGEIIKIQSQFNGDINLVEPHRRFLKEGALQEVVSSDMIKTKDIYVHLFNDIIIFSQKSGTRYTLKQQLPLNDLIIFSYINLEDQIDDLIFKIQAPGKAVVLKASSKDEKESWTIQLHNLIKECKNSKKNKTLNVDVHTIADDSSTTFALAMSDNDGIVIPADVCIERMKQGSTMLKYCRSAKPHFRRFVLSLDGTELMWGSPNKQSNESIVSLTDVKKICYGQNTAIFQKYKNPDLEGLSFSLLYRDRTLDIVCKDKQEYHTWVQGITYLLSHMDQIIKKGSTLPTTASSSESKFAPPSLVHDMENEKAKFKEQFERIGDAYTWGQGSCGGLGNGTQDDKKDPMVMKDFLYLDVAQVACENSGGAAVMFTGELFTWGKGERGRLGHSDSNDRIKPTYVKSLQGRNIKHVCMGNLHTLALDDVGAVFAFGDYQYGQCGIEKFDSFLTTPTVLPICNNGFKVTKIACGHWHSAIVSNDGQLLTFGRGEDGQLGHGDKLNRHSPTRVRGVLDDYKIVDVACGLWHTMALTEEGYLFTWGNNTYGQLGHNNNEELLFPVFVETFRSMPVKQIAAGSAHSGCITESDGGVYMWGNGIYGQIGNNTNTHALSPMRVKLGKLKGKQLVCGVNHVLCLMDDGSVYGWGAGTYGRLGVGNEIDQRVPIRISFFDDKTVRGLGAGGCQSAAVCAHQWVPDKDATDCMSCKSRFTFLRRRHHCRYCGGIFCGGCTSKRITLLRFGFDEPVRVCENCYQILTNAAQTYKR